MKYVTMLEIHVKHEYAPQSAYADVTFVPTPETEKLLRVHRCLARHTPGTVRVDIAVDKFGNAVLPLAEQTTLRFALDMQGTTWAERTDLAPFEVLALPLFTNRDVGNAGTLALVADPNPDAKKPPNVLANLEIVFPDGGRPAAKFTVELAAQKAHWAYYCVTNLSSGPDGLHIVDTNTGADALSFDSANAKVFDAATAASEFEKDPLAASLVKQNPGERCLRFLSDEPIGLSSEPRRGLELRLGPDCVTRRLPNPPARSTTAITLDVPTGSSGMIAARVQIIRYIAKH